MEERERISRTRYQFYFFYVTKTGDTFPFLRGCDSAAVILHHKVVCKFFFHKRYESPRGAMNVSGSQ